MPRSNSRATSLTVAPCGSVLSARTSFSPLSLDSSAGRKLFFFFLTFSGWFLPRIWTCSDSGCLPFCFSGSGDIKCAPGWRHFRESCYQYKTSYVSFTNANKQCLKTGGHLVDINSAEENKFVGGLGPKSRRRMIWIGLTDQAKEGEWVWITRKAANFTALFSYARQRNTALNCAAQAGSDQNFQWGAIWCGAGRQFFCEKGKNSILDDTGLIMLETRGV